MTWWIWSQCARVGGPKSHTHKGYSHLLVFDADMVAVDSRAIIRTLNAAGNQSRVLRTTGCSLESSMFMIIDVGGSSNAPAKIAEATSTRSVTECDVYH